MNIVLVINHFQPKLGYQEFFLCQEWIKMGHKVTVVTSNYFFPFPEYEKTVFPILGKRKRSVGIFIERGIKTIRLPAEFILNGMALTLKSLDKILTRIKPDVVFCDGVYYPLAWQTASLKTKLNYCLIFDTHASTFNTQLRDTWIKTIYMNLFHFLMLPKIKKMANGFTAVGTSEKALLVNEYQLSDNQVSVIPLGADTDLFKFSQKSRQSLKNKFNLANSEFVFIHAGKLTPEKDINVLIEAFIQVAKKYSHVHLFIVGGGAKEYLQPIKKQLRRYPAIEQRVRWIPPQPQAKLAEFYSLADVGIWPGNLTNTIQEAMASSLPVVLSKHISSHQTTDHFKFRTNIIQCQRGKVVDFAQAMTKYLTDQNLFRQARKDSRKFIEDTCSWKIIAQQHLAVHEKSCTK